MTVPLSVPFSHGRRRQESRRSRVMPRRLVRVWQWCTRRGERGRVSPSPDKSQCESDQVVDVDAERLGERGQGSSRARADAPLDLRQIEWVDPSGTGELLLGHAAMVPVYSDGVLSRQKAIRQLDWKRLSPHRLGVIVKLFVGYPCGDIQHRQASVRQRGGDCPFLSPFLTRKTAARKPPLPVGDWKSPLLARKPPLPRNSSRGREGVARVKLTVPDQAMMSWTTLP